MEKPWFPQTGHGQMVDFRHLCCLYNCQPAEHVDGRASRIREWLAQTVGSLNWILRSKTTNHQGFEVKQVPVQKTWSLSTNHICLILKRWWALRNG